jgi:branched-chain amino acid transport system permease protein
VLLLQQIVNGLMLGGIYALFAVGLSLALGVFRILNLAHGATLSVSAIFGIEVAIRVHIGLFPLLVVGAAAGAVLGLILEFGAFRWIRRDRRRSEESRAWAYLIASLAMLNIYPGGAQYYTFRIANQTTLSFPFGIAPRSNVTIGAIVIPTMSVVMFGTGLALALATWWVIAHTQAGRAARAVAADPEAAGMIGINVQRAAAIVLGASSAMAGITGTLVGVAFGTMDFTTGSSYLLKGIAVVVIGGLGSIIGTLIGGLLLGVVGGLTVYFIGSAWVDVCVFGLLVLVLLARPQGLFGRAAVDRA